MSNLLDVPAAPDKDLAGAKNPAQVRGMFHTISKSYDVLNHAFSLGIDHLWRQRVARMVISRETQRVLDVCSGTGDLAQSMRQRAERLGVTPLIVSCDFTPSMVRLAREKFDKSTASARPPVAVADALNLAYPSGHFDVVTVAFGIRNVADYRGGLAEMARVCRPGGTIAVLEFSKPTNAVVRLGFGFYFDHILTRLGDMVTGTRAYRYLNKSVADFPHGEAFAAAVTEATGSPCVMKRLFGGVATIYVSEVRVEASARGGGA